MNAETKSSYRKLRFAILATGGAWAAAAVFAIPFGFIAGWFFELCWEFAIPHLLPGAMEQGLVAGDISPVKLWPLMWLLTWVFFIPRFEKAVERGQRQLEP